MSAIEKITEAVSKGIDHVAEIVKERLFSPMYFYFLIAWVITNWKFVEVLFFVDESSLIGAKGILKVEYLSTLYSFGTLPEIWISMCKLFLLPAGSAFILVWYVSKLSALFYGKNEEYMMSKRIIHNDLIYKEKVHYARAQREIRAADADDKDEKYDDNKEFNEFYDNGKDNVLVGEYDFLPSEVLYNTDYQAYREELEKYKSIRVEDIPF